MNNGHGLVAYSAQMPSYSTELLISNLNYDCSAIDWPQGLHQNLLPNNQSKDLILVMHFHHLGTIMCFSTICKISIIYFASCHSTHKLATFPGALAHFSWIQTMLSWPNRTSPLKNVFMHAILLRHETVLLAQEKNLLAYCWVSP